jgi:hypothetical protein
LFLSQAFVNICIRVGRWQIVFAPYLIPSYSYPDINKSHDLTVHIVHASNIIYVH